jgi:O-antigen/teichoic acid export membrane protein
MIKYAINYNKRMLKISSERTRLIIKQISASSIYKVLSVAITFFLVPLSISYLGSEKYGLWLTIFSFIGWFSFFDFGIGNGLRNKLTITLNSDDTSLAKAYVSTAYFSMTVIMLLLIVLFIVPFYMIPWNSVFNYSGEESLSKLIAIVYVIFSINLVLKMLTAIYYADQKSSLPGLIQFLGQFLIFISIYTLMKSDETSLVLYGGIVVGTQMIVFIFASFIAFLGKYSSIRPSLAFYDKSHLKEILSLGGKFFLIQITYVLIYSTDNFIINYFFGAHQVTVFNIAFQYFMIATIVMSLILEPYWSAFTSALENDEQKWIKNSLKNLLTTATLLSVIVIIMIYIADIFYYYWIGDTVKVPFSLTVIIGILTILQIYMRPLFMFINGSGKVKIQMYLGVLLAFINIPLSILFAVYFNLGVPGVLLATVATRMIELIMYPIQVYRLVNKTAKGLWNE